VPPSYYGPPNSPKAIREAQIWTRYIFPSFPFLLLKFPTASAQASVDDPSFFSTPSLSFAASMTFLMKPLLLISAFSLVAEAYWLMGASKMLLFSFLKKIVKLFTDNILTTQRLDPIVSPGQVSSHVHAGNSDPDRESNSMLTIHQ